MKKIILTIVSMLLAGNIIAAEYSNTEEQAEADRIAELKKERVNKFKPVILPFYDPSIEAGIMAIPIYAFYPDENDLISDASTIALPLIYTSNKSLISKLVGDIILNEDTFRIQFETGYTRTYFDLAGVANKKESKEASADFLFNVYKDIYLGAGAVYKSIKNTADDPADQAFLNSLGFSDEYNNDAGYRLSVQWDTREHYYYPYSGFMWKFNYENHAEWLGNDEDAEYSSLFTDFRYFKSVNGNKNRILAAKFVSRYLIDAENAPASAYSMYGRQGKEVQRGFQVGKYVASNMANLEVEYRHKFSGTDNEILNKSTLVAIAGAGKSFGKTLNDNEEHFKDGRWLGVIGIGYRYRILPYERLNIKVDLTYNNDGETIIYFGFGETI